MKKNIFFIIFSVLIVIFTIYIVLDTFVIPKEIQKVSVAKTDSEVVIKSDNVVKEDDKYEDNNISILLTTYREYNTNIYVADIKLSDSSLLKTALANNVYGKNITDTTSNISESVNAILAINGDYYGVQEKGYVLKNGQIYRNEVKNNQEDLVIYKDGSFEIINENNISIEDLLDKGAYNILSFGPGLIDNYNIIVDINDEVGRAMASNPRTSIGIIDDNHYVFVVSDGRTGSNDGLTLYELASFMQSLNVKTAYNLDGGGSSTMYFNGNIINNPTTNGRGENERSVSDIVYIGY